MQFAIFGAVTVTAFVGVAGVLFYLLHRSVSRRPDHDPKAFRRQPRAAASIVVVCAGDSLTHATMSSDYVARLRARFAERRYEFVNAGINGHTALDLLQRLDAIIACQPDAVSILIGTNDARGGLPEPAESSYRANLDLMLTRLARETKARVALLSVPPLGEDLASPDNRGVDRCNAIVRELAAAHRAAYLPLHETLRPLLERSARPPAKLQFGIGVALSIAFRRYVLQRSWDEISTENGLVILTDQIHLSDRAAEVIADQLSAWLTSSASADRNASVSP